MNWNFIKKDSGWSTIFGLILLLVITALAYYSLHQVRPGLTVNNLNKDEQAYIANLLSDTTAKSTIALNEYAFSTGDTIRNSTVVPISRASAVNYMIGKLRPVNAKSFINKYIYTDNLRIVSNLSDISAVSYSYFWLDGNIKYMEVIFWSIFGVIANLLYAASEARRKNEFKTNELPIYAAKLFYAPIIALVIVLSFNMLTTSGNLTADVSSVNLVIFSFILGFFSGRAFELLNKIKDILLPGREKPDEDKGKIILTGQVFTKDDDDFDGEKTRIIVKSKDDLIVGEVFANKEKFYYITQINPGVYNIYAEVQSDDEKFTAFIPEKILSEDTPVEKVDLELKSNKPLEVTADNDHHDELDRYNISNKE